MKMEENQIKDENVVENQEIEDENVEEIDSDDEQEQEQEKVYTQEDIDALQAQIDELKQYEPEEKSEKEIELEAKADELWQKEVSLTLKEEGLEDFADFINVESYDIDALKSQIKKLNEIIGKLEVSNTYQPSNHKPADGYSIAKKNKDVAGMIKNKLKF